jgi:hypothetical protein
LIDLVNNKPYAKACAFGCRCRFDSCDDSLAIDYAKVYPYAAA